MAGFAFCMHAQQPRGSASPLRSPDDCPFLAQAAAFTGLPVVSEWAASDAADIAANNSSANAIAVKFNAACSLHTTISRDARSASWLLAAGNLLDTSQSGPSGSLDGLLNDYLRLGEAVFTRLDGQFGLVLYDGRDGTTRVVSDPFGLLPIYYAQSGGQVWVSTSALAVARAAQSAPSAFGLRSFVVYGTTFGDTLWQDVHLLAPATILRIGADGLSQQRYWAFNVQPEVAALSQRAAVDGMIDHLSDSMKRSVGNEAFIWLSLTGGLDSRTLAALAQHSQIAFTSYCHGPRDARDVRIAAQISAAMGWPYQYFGLPDEWGRERVNWLEQVSGQTGGLLDGIKMTRTIREQTIKASQGGVSLWGYGGELYRGYYWKQELWRTGASTQVNYQRLMDLRVLPNRVDVLRDASQWKGSLRAEIIARFQQVGEEQPDWLNTTKLDLIGTALERHACGTTIGAVASHQRVLLPFEFKENIAFAFSLPHRYRGQARLFRLMLERLNPRLAALETADGGPALPMRLSNAARFAPYWLDLGEKLLWKMGHRLTGQALWRRRDAGPMGSAYPLGRWLQDTLTAPSVADLLDPQHMRSAQFYDPRALMHLLAAGQAANAANENLLGRILAVEMALMTSSG